MYHCNRSCTTSASKCLFRADIHPCTTVTGDRHEKIDACTCQAWTGMRHVKNPCSIASTIIHQYNQPNASLFQRWRPACDSIGHCPMHIIVIVLRSIQSTLLPETSALILNLCNLFLEVPEYLRWVLNLNDFISYFLLLQANAGYHRNIYSITWSKNLWELYTSYQSLVWCVE